MKKLADETKRNRKISYTMLAESANIAAQIALYASVLRGLEFRVLVILSCGYKEPNRHNIDAVYYR